MNGFEKKSLDEDAFGDKKAPAGLKTFDAFREYHSDLIPNHHAQ
jgi:hypothetical protein